MLFYSLLKGFLSFLFRSISYYRYFPLSAGPGPVDTPTISGLQPRSVSITWVPPTQPNGIIRNYTLYLYPSSVTSLHYKPSSFSTIRWTPNPSLLPSTKGAYLNSGHNPRPSSSLTTHQDSSHIAILKPGIADNQNESTHVVDVSEGTSTFSFHPTEPDITSVSASLSVSTPQYSAVNFNTEHFMEDGPFHSAPSSAASRSTPLSVTVLGNTTNYTFLSLLPYQAYSFQVLHFS